MLVGNVLMSHERDVLAGLDNVLCTHLLRNCTRNGLNLGMLMSHEVVDCMKDVMIHVLCVLKGNHSRNCTRMGRQSGMLVRSCAGNVVVDVVVDSCTGNEIVVTGHSKGNSSVIGTVLGRQSVDHCWIVVDHCVDTLSHCVMNVMSHVSSLVVRAICTVLPLNPFTIALIWGPKVVSLVLFLWAHLLFV